MVREMAISLTHRYLSMATIFQWKEGWKRMKCRNKSGLKWTAEILRAK